MNQLVSNRIYIVFKNNVVMNENEEEEYISCDENHFAIYTHGDKSRAIKNYVALWMIKMVKWRVPLISRDGKFAIEMFCIWHCLCV